VRRGDAVSAEPLLHSAFHEAGHVVIARRLGVAVERVSIIPRVVTILVESLKTHDKASIEIAGLILLAREASQRRFRPRGVENHHVEADRAALDGIIDEHDIPRLLSRSEEMIRESWSEIEALARLLLERGRIDFLTWKAGSCPRDPTGRLILEV
jgi:hypothetical protein